MLVRSSGEGVLGVAGCAAADGRDEGEEEALNDETPGEEADDGAVLVAPIAPAARPPDVVGFKTEQSDANVSTGC